MGAALAVAGAAAPGWAAVTVASKSFTENVILGEITVGLVRAIGIEATHRQQLGGTRVLWEALRAGQIDVYPEYTGTLIEEIFAREKAEARAGDGDSVTWLTRRLEREQLRMTQPLGFNNTYAIGMTETRAAALGMRRISDLVRHPELHLGFSNEFMDRGDGWPALRARYRLPQTNVRGVDHDLAYRGLTDGAIDAIDLYATDAEIALFGLRVLEDDRRHFPEYQVVLLYRADLQQRAPLVPAALARLEGKIPATTMTALNARARRDKIPESAIAADFLAGTFGLQAAVAASGWWATLGRHTSEHLFLVALSLLAAVIVAVPLGVAGAASPRVGQLILGVTGILQTVPSLALLVFMIPLLGIGSPPALMALFLYSLLPIVRNTHAGLMGIAPSLRESALALGLPPAARLRLVDLPLAMPSILAGIKTSAVINVGTATLGALIGAGGYGQPILTGIRLNDVGLIMQGAVPAALLALLIEQLFAGIERLVVPRGVRLRARRS
ncbi:MAG TPA: glycine betaine ABC transporter substrate-binding protein [Polyangia bacterium]|nr:glycine betaine ABC transporter substrate-binding protein [Polyangia bacterium]